MEYLTEKQFAFRILLTDYVKTVIRENNTFSAILHRLKILASFIFFWYSHVSNCMRRGSFPITYFTLLWPLPNKQFLQSLQPFHSY